MSDRMPTTAEVRERFVDGFPMDTWVVSRDECGRDFDRWLAAFIAEKQAEALEQAAAMVTRGSAVTLRAMARHLREQATNQPDRSET